MSQNRFEWLIIILASLALLFSDPCNAQQNYKRYKGSLVERNQRAIKSMKYAPKGTPYTGRVYFKPPSDAKYFPYRGLDIKIEGGYKDEKGIWWIKYDGQKNFNVIVKLLACNKLSGGVCDQRPQYVQNCMGWKKMFNREMDITGGIWWDSDIVYKIADHRAKSNVYNKFSTMRNGQGKAIMGTRLIKVNELAYDQLTNIAPDGRSMFGYANRKQDQNYEPYDTKGVFRLDSAMQGMVFGVEWEFRTELGQVVGSGKLMIGVY